MEKQNILLHIQSNEEFWDTFYKSLKSPISYWRNIAELSKDEWINDFILNDAELLGYLKIIFDNAPLFKGEYPLVYAPDTGMILTNYRLFCNMTDLGLFIIPLFAIKKYGDQFYTDENEVVYNITFTQNGEKLEINAYNIISQEFINNAKNKKEWKKLSPEILPLLAYSFFDFESEFKIKLDAINIESLHQINNFDKQKRKPKQSHRNKGNELKTYNSKDGFSFIKYLSPALILIGIIYSIVHAGNSSTFDFGIFIIAFIIIGIIGVIIFIFLDGIMERIFFETHFKVRKILKTLTLLLVLVISVNFTDSINSANSKVEYNGNSSSVGTGNMVSCSFCGRSYNKNSFGEKCGNCWKTGTGMKCVHGNLYKDCCMQKLTRP